MEYVGGYDYFLSKQPERLAQPARQKKAEDTPNEYKQKKQRDAEKRKRAAALRRLEQQIAEKEAEAERLSSEAAECSGDYQRAMELTSKLDEANSELEALYEKWEIMAEDSDE